MIAVYITVLALFTALALVPLLARWAGPLGLLDQPGPRKIHDHAIPRVGGIAIALGALLFPALQQAGYPEKFNLGLVTSAGSLGLLFVPIVAINAAGGWDTIMATLAAEDPGLTDMFSLTDDGFPGWIAIASFVGIGLPFLGVPQMLIRYMSARDEMELKKARVVSIVVLFIFLFGAVTAGIAGRALFPGLEDAEQVFPDKNRGNNVWERP